MQDIHARMIVDGGLARWVDAWGKAAAPPVAVVGVSCRLVIDLCLPPGMDDEQESPPYPLADLQGIHGWYVAIDNDYDRETAPKLVKITGIAVDSDSEGRTILTAELPSTAHPGLIEAVNVRKTVTLTGDIGGVTAEDQQGNVDTVFIAAGWKIVVLNRVWLPDGTLPEEADPQEYFTAVQTLALIGGGLVMQYSEDGSSWHDTQTVDDEYFRMRFAAADAGDWTPAITIPKGQKGDKGDRGDLELGDTVPAALAATAAIGDTGKAADAGHVHSTDGLMTTANRGAADGVASLGSDGKVPTEQLPDVVNAATRAAIRRQALVFG